MQTRCRKLTQAILLASLSTVLGAISPISIAAEDFGYCAISACDKDAISFRSFLGLGKGKLSWWDCRAQNTCADIRNDLQKLQMTEKDCSIEKLDTFKKDIHKLDEKLLDIAKKLDPKIEEMSETIMDRELNDEMWTHFSKCYKEGLLKPDPKKCLTSYCDAILTRIDELEFNAQSCQDQLPDLSPNPEKIAYFPYEDDLIKNHLAAYKTKCEEAGLLTAYSAYGRAVTKDNVDFAKKCEEKGSNIKKRIDGLKVTAIDCTKAVYDSLHKDLDEFEGDLKKLFDISKKDTNSTEEPNEKISHLRKVVDEHFAKCESHGLFKHEQEQKTE